MLDLTIFETKTYVYIKIKRFLEKLTANHHYFVDNLKGPYKIPAVGAIKWL